MKTIALLFVVASCGWAAEIASSVTQPPPPLTAEQKLEIVKIQRDLAYIDREEQRIIEQTRKNAEGQRAELQQRLNEVARKLVPQGWKLTADLEFIPAKAELPPPEEP